MSGAAPLLEARGLGMDFGGVRALEGVDLAVGAGEIAALIGPNGAGKTTLFNCVTGLYRPSAGSIVVRPPRGGQRRITGLAPHRITALGLARTFQNIRLFPEMTVLENVMVGRHARTRAGVLGAVLRDRRTREEERAIAAASRALLAETGLADCAGAPAASLPYGSQRRLEIARALAAEPFVLLLDEPAAGMNPRETAALDELIRAIRDRRGIAVVLIEHDMRLVMGIADRVVVLDAGRRIADGPPAVVRRDPAVIRAYLGEDSGA